MENDWAPTTPPDMYLVYNPSLPVREPNLGRWSLMLHGKRLNQPCPKPYMRTVVKLLHMDVTADELPVFIPEESRWEQNWAGIEAGETSSGTFARRGMKVVPGPRIDKEFKKGRVSEIRGSR